MTSQKSISKEKVNFIVNNLQDISRWLYWIEKIYGTAVANYAEEYHEKIMHANIEAEKHYYKIEKPKVLDLVQQFKNENIEFSEECKKRKHIELVNGLEEKKEQLEKLLQHRGNLEKKEQLLKEAKNIEKILKLDISEEMVETARNAELSKIIEINSRYFSICVNHDDKNASMYCKNNYAYCFSCNWTGNTLDVLMKKENITFKEAVLRLQ
jgi:hypothetical protein